MNSFQLFVVFTIFVLAIIAMGCVFKPSRSPFAYFGNNGVPGVKLPDPFFGGVLNAKYQYDSPNVVKEAKYYRCMQSECGGNTHDYDCLERCRLKTMMDHDLRYVSPLKASNCFGKTGDDYVNCLVYQYALNK
jgi:hypothetical protein